MLKIGEKTKIKYMKNKYSYLEIAWRFLEIRNLREVQGLAKEIEVYIEEMENEI